jgi:nicotinate-nucleotide adenylyltransferase
MKPDSIRDSQNNINKNYLKIFGRTPLRQRLNDISKESSELVRYLDMMSLKEEASDLLGTLVQLCNECGWSVEELLQMNIKKIQKRRKQYQALGRKIQVAIIGGAFDCVTDGHVEVAKLILNYTMLFDEVYLMPCYEHMNNKKMASPEHRLEMCRIAAQVDGRIKPFDYEIRNKFRGETYNLAKRLLEDKQYKDTHSFSFVIGLDNANTFDTWLNYEELERLARFIVVTRTGEKRKAKVDWYLKPPHIFIEPETPLMQISSTEVRNSIKELSKASSPNGLFGAILNDKNMAFNRGLDPNVLQYVLKNRLYF